MSKLKILMITISFLIVSCNTDSSNSADASKMKTLEDQMRRVASKMDAIDKLSERVASLEKEQANTKKSIKDLKDSHSHDNKKKPDNKKSQNANSTWKSETVYASAQGDSYYMGPANAKVVITEWTDYF